jgi:predicted transcriptional regulator
MASKINLSKLLGRGDVNTIATKLGLSQAATSAAIRRANPGHPAVREALRIAQESGALTTAQQLASLNAATA